jgi:Tol biopolymer transport system component
LRAIADARLALDEVLAPRTRSRVGHAAAAVSIISGLIVVATVLWTQSRHRLPERSEWTQVTKLPDSVMQPALSPDGRMLAFLRGPNTFIGPAEVYVKMLPDGEPVQLTHDGTSKMSPAFSPDGSRIAYSVIGQHGEAWDTWTVPVLGGTPELWLPNASALTWVDAQHVLFSEIKTRVHLAITTSLESRADSRDVYLPAHDHGMAHRSFVSPDHQSVLVVEMDETDSWMPCRLVPFDGSTHGRPVGPPGPCTSAAWSPDGKWMYFSAAKPGDNYHLWRQRFPDGVPEQISSGPTEEEGIVVSSDGRTLVTAVGMRQRPISLHDETGDHQISLEGYAFVPRLYAAGKKVYYRISRTGAMFKQGVEIWMGDLASGHNEPVLPGFSVQQTHDISEDGRLLVAATGPDKKSHLWLARLDRRTPPRQIPGVESDWALLDPSGGVLFLANVGTGRFLFHIRDDGTGKKQVSTQPIQEIWGVSPDGAWVSGEGPGQDTSSFDYAYSTRGFPPVAVCNPPCRLRWAHDGQFLYFSIPKGYMFYGGVGLTYVLPVRTGTAFPDLPATGFRSEAELAAAPGVRIIEAADVDPGPSPTVYVFSRQVVQRNLYRIPLQ